VDATAPAYQDTAAAPRPTRLRLVIEYVPWVI